MSVLKEIKYVSPSFSLRWIKNKPRLSNLTVVNALKIKYPNANAVKWQQIEVSIWKANFTLKNKRYSALFDSHGKWLDTISLVSMELKTFTG
jgi:hypothetical protein